MPEEGKLKKGAWKNKLINTKKPITKYAWRRRMKQERIP